jgi:hypothetical protein
MTRSKVASALVLVVMSILLILGGSQVTEADPGHMGDFVITGEKPDINVTPKTLVGEVGDTWGINNQSTSTVTVRLVDCPPTFGCPPGTSHDFPPGSHLTWNTAGWPAGTYVLEFDPPDTVVYGYIYLAPHYSWEDCGVLLGMYGTGDPPIIAGTAMEGHGPPPAAPPPRSGLWSLRLEDNSPSGTPQAYLAWVTGLADGDSVVASFWRYDTTPAGSPSCRIWAHYTTSGDIDDYQGSAGGNDDYGPGMGWDVAHCTWYIDTAGGTRDALVIECRTYSDPGDVVWIDDLSVSASGDVTIYFPVAGSSPTRPMKWGEIKALYR